MVRLELALALLLTLAGSAYGQGSTSTSPSPFACPSKANISQTSSTQIVTGTTGQVFYICGIVLANGATAQSANVVFGTGTLCATGISSALGGTTAATGLTFAANGWFAAVEHNGWVKAGAAGNNMCVLQSGTTQLSGVVTYRSAP